MNAVTFDEVTVQDIVDQIMVKTDNPFAGLSLICCVAYSINFHNNTEPLSIDELVEEISKCLRSINLGSQN